MASLTWIDPIERAEHAEDAALGAGRHHAWRRRLRVEAPVARAVFGPEDAGLAVKTEDRTPHVRLAEQHASIIDQVTGREIVCAVHDQVVVGEDLHDVVHAELLFVHHNVHIRVDLVDTVPGRLSLRPAYVGLAVDDLPLQVRLVHYVEIDNTRGCPRQRPPGTAELASPGRPPLRIAPLRSSAASARSCRLQG